MRGLAGRELSAAAAKVCRFASVVQRVRWQGAGGKAGRRPVDRRQRSQRAWWAARSRQTLVDGVLARNLLGRRS